MTYFTGIKMTDSRNVKVAQPYLLAILMFTIAIDVMGFGLILPLFPTLFFSEQCVFGGMTIHMSYVFYGIAFALWPAGAFFGTPFLGLLSDKIGRKKIITVCLFCTGLSYALCGLSISLNNLWLFLLTRLFAGFFGGSYDIAQAGVADISLPENKARNMGLITFAVAIGVILGPAISGFTTDSSLISWFTVSTPFWISSILAILNALFILIMFKDIYQPDSSVEVKISKIFSSFTFIFRDRRVAGIGMAFLFLSIAWGMYITAMPLLLEKLFNTSIQMTGVFFCILGFGNAVAILFIQKHVLKKMSLGGAGILFSFLLMILYLLLIFYIDNKIFEYVSAIFMAIFELLAYSSILAMCSNAVTEKEQGRVMGGLGAVASIAFFVSGVVTANLVEYNLRIPMIIIFLSYLFCTLFLLMVKFKKTNLN
jgi:MFS transporter, DHA1 family, tetracycline resistance protein